MAIKLTLSIILLLYNVRSYLDIQVQVHRQNNYVSYSIPIKINNLQYNLTTSLQDNKEFILSPHQKQPNKKGKKTKISDASLVGVLQVSSLQGYSFEGWKRFFMEALLYIESRYYHQIDIKLDDISVKKQIDELKRDGLIAFGPTLQSNKIYQLIKASTDLVKNDIISIYRGVNDKNVRIQLGGFQQTYARGHRNGILFYEMQIKSENGKWWIPIKSVYCMKERGGKQETFYLVNSNVNLGISIQSPFLKLPLSFSSEFERNFQSNHASCKINSENMLSCLNMSSIDLSLNFISLQVDQGAFINISLYDLRQSYNQKTTQTIFYIQFVQKQSEYQLGQSIFKSFYTSIDMKNSRLLFSPINRYPSESYGVYVVRFLIGFTIFTVVSAICVMVWQMFNDPFKKNKLTYSQDGGVRLVSYQKTNEIDE